MEMLEKFFILSNLINVYNLKLILVIYSAYFIYNIYTSKKNLMKHA
jgi:hypothetical protein